MNDSLEQGNKEEALKIAETELTLSSSALEQLKELVEQNLSLVIAKGTSKMADVVMGTNGVKNVRSKASAMFDKYTKMVEAYHYAEDNVRGNIEDFTSLRSDMGIVYRDYAMKLIDIYGDSIKMVQPDLFDFKRIEWLDVDEMLKYVELEYNKLSEKCAALIGEISDNSEPLCRLRCLLTSRRRTATSRWAWLWQVWRCLTITWTPVNAPIALKPTCLCSRPA